MVHAVVERLVAGEGASRVWEHHGGQLRRRACAHHHAVAGLAEADQVPHAELSPYSSGMVVREPLLLEVEAVDLIAVHPRQRVMLLGVRVLRVCHRSECNTAPVAIPLQDVRQRLERSGRVCGEVVNLLVVPVHNHIVRAAQSVQHAAHLEHRCLSDPDGASKDRVARGARLCRHQTIDMRPQNLLHGGGGVGWGQADHFRQRRLFRPHAPQVDCCREPACTVLRLLPCQNRFLQLLADNVSASLHPQQLGSELQAVVGFGFLHGG